MEANTRTADDADRQAVNPKPRLIYTRPGVVHPIFKPSYHSSPPLLYRYRATNHNDVSGGESDEPMEDVGIENDHFRYSQYEMFKASHHYRHKYRHGHTDRSVDRPEDGSPEYQDDVTEAVRDSRCSSPSLPRKKAKLSNDDNSSNDWSSMAAAVGISSLSGRGMPSPVAKDLSKQSPQTSSPLSPHPERNDDGEEVGARPSGDDINGDVELEDGDEDYRKSGWSFKEQFKQLYELSDSPERKQFLDDLFSFMQKRGTPVNRIPIMAKQVLDLYELYNQVVAKGGLVEVINKKQWREITKGLNLPASITSAAFTLRTQYMKYLYPYECAMKSLSSPAELQAAIDGNKREGRRPAYHTHGPLSYGLHPSALSPPPTMIPRPARIEIRQQVSPRSPTALYGEDRGLPHHRRLSDGGLYLQERATSPPLHRKPYLPDELAERLLLHPQPIQPSAHFKMTSRKAHPETGFPMFEFRGDNTMVVSIELNGLLYQGVLYPCGAPRHLLHPAGLPRQPLSSHD